MMKPALSIVLIAIALLLGACIDLKPAPDPTRYYVLGSTMGSNGALNQEGLRIGLREVNMPKYLESSRVALRKGAHEVVYLPFERWGEDISVSAARSLAATLEQDAKVRYVSIFPWPSVVEHDYVLRVQFAHFEGSMNGEVFVSGRWTVADPKANTVVLTEGFNLDGRWNGSEFSDLANALSRALGQLGEQIAQQVASLPPVEE